MMKSIRTLLKQLKERYRVPRRVQDVIPINRIWTDGIFMVGHHQFAKTWRFTDINYLVASREDKERMFLSYSELLNSLDSGSSVKITINNRRMWRSDFENSILMRLLGDSRDYYREEYNKVLLSKALDAKDICDFCNTKYGFDYYLFNKKSSVLNRKKHITGTFAKQLIKKYARNDDRIFTPDDRAN